MRFLKIITYSEVVTCAEFLTITFPPHHDAVIIQKNISSFIFLEHLSKKYIHTRTKKRRACITKMMNVYLGLKIFFVKY